MESLERLRKAAGQHAGRSLGLRADIPRYLLGQQRAARREADILAMPISLSNDTQDAFWMPLRIVDSASGFFGQHAFMVGYDGIGQAPLG